MDIKAIRVSGQTAKNVQPFQILEFANATINPDTDEPNVGVITLGNGSNINPRVVTNVSELVTALNDTSVNTITMMDGTYATGSSWSEYQLTRALTINALGTVSITTTNNNNVFIRAISGSLTCVGLSFTNWNQVVGFRDNQTDVIFAIKFIDCEVHDSALGGLTAYFPTQPSNGVMVQRWVCRNNVIDNCRHGIHYRGRYQNAQALGNRISNYASYALRFGRDFLTGADWYGASFITNNEILIGNNTTPKPSGFESNAISMFGDSSEVCGNRIVNQKNQAVDDDEAIYLKVRQATVYGNNLTDAGDAEGCITIKGNFDDSAESLALIKRATNVFGNTIRYTAIRDKSVGINIQKSNTNVFDNVIEGCSSKGIFLDYHGSWENVHIFGNTIRMVAGGADLDGSGTSGIDVWFYGQDITVENNTIIGDVSYGIKCENRDNSDVRYPTDGSTPISDGLIVRNNNVRGLDTMIRGVNCVFSGPAVSHLIIEGNVLAHCLTGLVMNPAVTGSTDWQILNNHYHNNVTADQKWFAFPANLTLRGEGYEGFGQSSVSSASTTKTFAHGIQGDIAALLTTADIKITPGGPWGNATKFWPSSVASLNGTVTVDTVPGSGGFSFNWEVSIKRIIP